MLDAGNAAITPDQLLTFAQHVKLNYPGAVIRLEEYALRVTELSGDRRAQPYLRFEGQ